MNRFSLALLVPSLLLSACVPGSHTIPAHSDICQPSYEFKAGGETFVARYYLYNRKLALVHDYPEQFSFSLKPPIKESIKFGDKYVDSYHSQGQDFYVSLLVEQKSWSNRSPKIPVYYQSQGATLTARTPSGTKTIKAYPKLILSSKLDTPNEFDMAYRVGGQINIQDPSMDKTPSSKKTVRLKKGYVPVHVAFPTSDYGLKLSPQSDWSINMGQLMVNGQTITLPTLRLCPTGDDKRFRIIPLMRP